MSLNKKQTSTVHQRIWSLSGPMMLSNISLPLLGLVDTAVMGHLETATYLAAVSVGAMIIHFVFWAFGFLRMSTVGLAAQSYGAENTQALLLLLIRASIFALAIAALILLLHPFILSLSLQLVKPDANVIALTAEYFDIRIWSAPAVLLTYVFLGWFLGIQKPRFVLVSMVFVNVLNIILDLVFVVGFKMGVEGVAFASLIAEYAGLILIVVLVFYQLKGKQTERDISDIFNWSAFKKLVSLNTDIFIRTVALLFVFAFFTTQGARAGDVVVAANAILLQFIVFMAYVLDAYAHAAEAMIGEAVGDRNMQRFKRYVTACAQWSFWSSVVFVLFFYIVGEQIINTLTDIQSVREYSYQYLDWMIWLPLIAVWSYLFDGVFIGATWSREMRNVMLLSVIIIYIPCWYFTRVFENHGLWVALMSFFIARSGLMAWSFRQKIRLGVSAFKPS